MRTRMIIGLSTLTAVAALLVLLSTLAMAQASQELQFGQTVSGEVATRLGNEWTFEACAGDVVTITMTSAEFDTFLELYAPTGREPLVTDDNSGGGTDAAIAGFALSDSGAHTIVAAGSGILDRGPYSLTLTLSGTTDLFALRSLLLTGTVPVTGSVQSRFGEEWFFRGCASQAVTLTMQSDVFTPALELYGSTGRDPLAVGQAVEEGAEAQIGGFVLPQNDLYAVIAAGESVLDRGPYTLTLVISATETLTLTEPITGTATITEPATATPVPLPAADPECTVAGSTLNLRSGPGVVFAPPIGALLQGTRLRPLARNLDASWIEVEVLPNGNTGWVSALPQFVTCNVDLTTLPPGIIPPAPTATATPTQTSTPLPTATPTPTATPDPLAGLPSPAGVVIQSPGGTGDLEGNVYTDPRIVVGTNAREEDPVFNEFFYLEAFAFDPNIPGAAGRSGAGIDRVEFRMLCPNGGEFVNTEETARYCMFGGGEPNCSVLRLVDGATIPGSNCVVENGFYDVEIQVFPENNNLDTANWNLSVQLEPPGTGQPEPEPQPQPEPEADLEAQIVRTGIDSNDNFVLGALVFQVTARDPNEGSNDGAGIEYVDLLVVGPDGQPVFGNRENTAAYCAFGGGEPCPAWDFAENNNQWPSGNEFVPGQHRLLAEVHAEDGRTLLLDRMITIEAYE